MKPLAVELAARDTWRGVWWVACTLIAAIAAYHGWKVHDRLSKVATLEARANALPPQAVLADGSVGARPAGTDVSADAVVRRMIHASLSRDANPMFSSLESLATSGSRLRSAQWDESTNMIRIEVEVTNLDQVSQITSTLNAGNERSPWRLTSAVSAPLSGRYLGQWAAMAGHL